MGPERQQFYRYTDPSGRVHLVSSLDSLPPEARAKAELLVLDTADTRQQQAILPTSTPLELDGPSFAIGFAAALVLALVYRFMPPSMRWVSRVAVVVGVAALGTGLYFGYLRQTTGAGTSALASPSAFIQDAKDAVEQVKEARRKQEAELRAIQQDNGAVPAKGGSSAKR